MVAASGRARIAYDSVGGDGGTDVLLIHAGVNDRRSWRHVVERLAPRHRCVSYDMRGYGETTYDREDGWSPVADAVAVLDAAGVARAVVVACSMGGQAASTSPSPTPSGWRPSCSSAPPSAALRTPSSPTAPRPS